MKNVFDEGRDAYLAGKLPADNPYPHDDPDHRQWDEGYRRAWDEDDGSDLIESVDDDEGLL